MLVRAAAWAVGLEHRSCRRSSRLAEAVLHRKKAEGCPFEAFRRTEVAEPLLEMICERKWL